MACQLTVVYIQDHNFEWSLAIVIPDWVPALTDHLPRWLMMLEQWICASFDTISSRGRLFAFQKAIESHLLTFLSTDINYRAYCRPAGLPCFFNYIHHGPSRSSIIPAPDCHNSTCSIVKPKSDQTVTFSKLNNH